MRVLLLMLLFGSAHATTITVYSLSDIEITGHADYRRVDLDQSERLLQQLGKDLPNDIDSAIEVVQGRMNAVSNRPLLDDIGDGFNGLLDAYANGIDRVPAIVIDDAVIYGVTDVEKAISLYRAEPHSPLQPRSTITGRSSVPAPARETISSAEIFSDSINFTCLDYELVGICVWLTVTPFSVSIDYSLKVKHYTPDAVVSAYTHTGENPWTDVAAYSLPNAVAQDGGSNTERNFKQQETALLFKNADVIGSPGSLWVDGLAESDYFCQTGTTPLFPYFLSTLDWSWRNPILESVATVANLFRSVSKGTSSWGPVYPRHGFINQGHDYKAGAVIAQRAGDIVTRNNQLHLYIPMTESTGRQGQWPPGPIIEGDEETHRWQQLIPASESGECRIFADISDAGSGINDPFKERMSPITGYAFNLWRPYLCCQQAGAVLIAHTGE